jgi:tRNA (cmo5U34)-methyltransferase
VKRQHTDVASHLKIPLAEYDARIRTFVPDYEEMLGTIATYIAHSAGPEPTILELGIGTGALSERCRRERPRATCIGIDMDAGMLEMAAARLGTERVELIHGSYTDVALPAADYIIATISLHHVRDATMKRALYRRCREALRPGGALLVGDCFLPRLEAARAEGLRGWQRFLERTYSAEEARVYLDAWAAEDTYFPMADELAWLADAGFETEIVWRRELLAVVAAS